MKNASMLMAIATLVIALSSAVQAEEEMLVPGYAAAREVPGANWIPDPNTEYKVVFDAARAAENVDDINPMLLAVARYVNTLGKYGVPAENRKIAVVFHQGAGPVVLKNEEFKARHDGHDNPNIELMRKLHAAGVALHVCGQGVTSRGIDPDDIQEEVQLDLWALTTLIEFGRQGYVKIG